MTFITYGIVDPVSKNIVYVGQTSDFERRKRDHNAAHRRRDVSPGSLQDWQKSLSRRKLKQDFIVLEVVESEAASLASETHWTEKLAAIGLPLFNQWEEHREAMAAMMESREEAKLRPVVFGDDGPAEVGRAERNRSRTGWRIHLEKDAQLGGTKLVEAVTVDLIAPPRNS